MAVEISLKGKNAIVTGAGAGIGKCIALRIAEAGANVYLVDLNEEAVKATAAEAAEKFGVKAGYCKCDVSKTDQVYAMADAAEEFLGRIDILDHCAGIFTNCDFLTATEDDFMKMLIVNTLGTFLVDQAVIKKMIPNGTGKVVNMSSQTGKHGFPTNVGYTTSKFGVTGMTQSIANYCAKYNINVNCVCPGIVRTDIWNRVIDKMNAAGEDGEAYFKSRLQDIPLKREQTVEDIANMYVYLSSDFAVNMTGQSINITGGKIM